MSDQSPQAKTRKTNRGWLRRNVPKAVIIVAAIAALTLISRLPTRKQDVAVSEAPPVNVTVLTVAAEPEFADTFDLPAVVEPNRIVTVSAEVAGQIERIPVKKGSTVRAGDLLVELNADLLRPRFESAEAQTRHDQTEYDRIAGLVKSGASPSRDLDNATTQLTISKANLEQIRATLERTRILAPTNGILNDVPVEEGEYVQPDARVAEIVDTDIVKVAVQVPERDIGFFATGQEAEVLLDPKGKEKPLVGTITFISELAHENTRSTRLEISLPNKQRLLRSGQIVLARLRRRILKDAILIPLLAVIPMEDSKAVYVVNSATAQRREVQLDIIRGDRVQVTRGLEPGDRLIVAGHRFVAPGQKVKIVSESK
ncbi:MAG: efflux RND transporter periplasmic adaptor subunit [Phycisphaerales bacterium]|nr:MAG: efflux RND transporter periplasmic adaptor subunit [Phycisphaerales bacterium]